MISAGNDYNSANQNLHGTNLALAGNPDYGIVGSPSTYAAALSVASVNENLAYSSYFLLGNEKISFDESPDSVLKIGNLEGTYEYVRVIGVGNANDFAKVDVSGKIALVERGEIAFTEKEQNAYDAGAVAMIVYNNSDVEETVCMQLNGLIPAVFLSKEEGKLLRNAAVKEVTVSGAFSGRMENPAAGQMSDFSSMGVAPDLSLKPEITAPGGNVWSTSSSGGYEEMSGTSMAAPHMTGAAALVRQYVNETYSDLSDFEKQELVDNLLMSTAVPVADPNGVSYTPRKQGAGLANVSAAIHAESYLTVDGGRPKAELGESEEGTYSFTFTVHNISDTAKTWNVSLDPIAAQTETAYGQDYISELCRTMEENELNVTFSAESVTVQPGETADVTVTIELTETGKEALSVFPNGIYVEGFVRLTGDDAAAMGLPYLGFYGDWADAPIFDSTMYDDETSFMAESAIAQMDYEGNGYYLGINAITENARAEWISYASRTAGYYMITPMQGLLRAPKEIWYTATSDADPENPVYVMGYENTYKSFYYASGDYIYTDFVTWADSWQPIGGTEEEGYYYLEDGPYTYRIDARIDGEEEYQSSTYPVYIDNQGPQILGHTYEVVDGKHTLTIQVTDNHYVMAAQLMSEDFTTALSDIIAVEETELGAITTLTFDLTDVQADGYKLCRLDLYDYAWNETQSDVFSTVSQDIQPHSINLSPYQITASVDSRDSEIVAYIDPANAVDQTLVWSSTDESVARIVSVSEDTHSAMIDYVGPGQCEIRATAVNGVYGACPVSIARPAAGKWPSDNVIREDGYYTVPENLNTTVSITDNAQKVWLTGAETNTQENPYQNLSIDSKNAGLDLTIENLHLKNGVSYNSANGINFVGVGNTLTLAGENSVTLADYSSSAAIHVPDSVELTVNGSGKLTVLVNHNAYGAGIGSNAGEDAGKIIIDGGSLDFVNMNAGAGIGTGSGNAKANIVINGGEIYAVSMSNGAAIGAGTASPKTNNNTRIGGGTVKAVSTGTGEAFRDTTLVNDDSDDVFLVNIEAPNVTSVSVNGKDWGISANHPEDDQLYLYLTASKTAHEVVVNGEDVYVVTVTPSGDVTVTVPGETDKSALTELYDNAAQDLSRLAE